MSESAEQPPAGAPDEVPEELGPVEGERSAAGGVPAVEAARERLGALEAAPLEEHVELFEDVHRRLQEGLADLDDR